MVSVSRASSSVERDIVRPRPCLPTSCDRLRVDGGLSEGWGFWRLGLGGEELDVIHESSLLLILIGWQMGEAGLKVAG